LPACARKSRGPTPDFPHAGAAGGENMERLGLPITQGEPSVTTNGSYNSIFPVKITLKTAGMRLSFNKEE